MAVYKRMESYAKYFPVWYEKLCDGGHGGHNEHYPITWNVKLVVPTWQQVWGEMVKQNYICESEAIIDLGSPRLLGDKVWGDDDTRERLWNWAVESMQEMNDADTYKTCRPEVYERWGVDPEMRFDVNYAFVGRSAGWLVIERFNGWRMNRVSVSDIGDWDCDNVRGLLCLMDEIHLCVPGRHEEVAYQMAWHLYHNTLQLGD